MTAVDYNSESSFGWLDYDAADADRMRELLTAFDDRDTIDSLGTGVIRDSFSDQLFPGINTVQTRARYFLFVPWAFRQLERDRVAPHELVDRLRDREVRVIEALRAGDVGPNRGVIGYYARKDVKRLPSSVYWNGLHQFGIRLNNLTMPEYRQSLKRHYEQGRRVERDDDGEPTTPVPRNWDPGLPVAPPGFPDQPTNFDLAANEAEYLTERIVTRCPGTLLASAAAEPDLVADATMPWDVPTDQLPAPLVELLWHGRNFSDVMHGAQLLYNVFLAEEATKLLKRDSAGLRDALLADVAAWANKISDRTTDLETWWSDERAFWAVVERGNVRVDPRTKRFVAAWVQRVISDSQTVASDPAVRGAIFGRERDLKGPLARLSERRALENWNGEPFGRPQLSYRWSVSTAIIDDIAAGRGASS